jgi:hypothetical protein
MEYSFQKGGAALDPEGNLWLASASDGQFPMVNAFQSQFGGGGDAFLAKLSFGEKLQISLAGQTIAISWPLSATGFVLESADSPSASASGWNTVLNPPITQGAQNVVTLAVGSGSQFFRLHKL